MHLERLSLNDAAQVAAVTALETAMWDWCPWRPEDFVHSIRAFPQDKLMEWYALLENGVISGYGSVLETFWLATPGQAQFGAGAQNFDVDRYRFIVEANLARLRELGFSRFMTSIPSKQSGYCQALENLGFTLNMRQKVSRLDITDIDLSVDPPSGWDLVNFSEYKARNPATFRHDLWQLIQEVLRDVPMPEPFVTEPFDDWAREYFKPDLDLDARVLAVKDGKPIGLSEIAPNKVEPAKALTGLTGVLRPYRRQGIARQLKIASILRAREKGVAELYTDNEENNPMFLLNLELGFEYVWDICVFTLNDPS